jgi:hypothetical protein
MPDERTPLPGEVEELLAESDRLRAQASVLMDQMARLRARIDELRKLGPPWRGDRQPPEAANPNL